MKYLAASAFLILAVCVVLLEVGLCNGSWDAFQHGNAVPLIMAVFWGCALLILINYLLRRVIRILRGKESQKPGLPSDKYFPD